MRRRARGTRRHAGPRPRPAGALHPGEQAGGPPDAGDAGRQVPPRHRRRRVRRHRRADHAGGLPRGAGRRDRRRVRHRGAGRAAAAQRRLPRRRRDAGRGAQRAARRRPPRRGVGHRSAGSCSARWSTCRSRASPSSTTGWRFAAEEVDGRRIRLVRITPLAPDDTAAERRCTWPASPATDARDR